MLLIVLIGMTLPFSVIALAIGAAYCVWLMLSGFPVVWGIAMALFSLFYMASAFKLMSFFTGVGGVRTNAAAAACLVPLLEVAFAFYFVTSPWPYELSAWWALLLPLTFVLHLLLQGALEYVLDVMHTTGKRQ